ncbi:hypothetical protein [Pseudomonas sp. zfem002]|uniref:hypothetical protein n=1 Tax=Pseudomonas sp. zfem002 TaxID=3078197 RepID=UPI0029296424|nr:hypothetical protein [Pseudomonas sp. zfem002]MDU9391563.1 hypothetical protein [Pseudomonas sp. zfem002]
MQAPHYMLALAVAWIVTLAMLPYLFAAARKRAYERGRTDGLDQRDALSWKRLQDLEGRVETHAVEREAEQRKHLHKTAALLGTITELEERIRAYTGLAVTAADHRLMTSAAETLLLANRTWGAMKGSEMWRDRAALESSALTRLGALVHAEVRRHAKTSTESAA